MGKPLKAYVDLDLYPTMTISKLHELFSYTTTYHIPRSIIFELACKNIATWTDTRRHKDPNEYL